MTKDHETAGRPEALPGADADADPAVDAAGAAHVDAADAADVVSVADVVNAANGAADAGSADDGDVEIPEHRPFTWRFYVIAFLVADIIAVGLLQWSVWIVEPLRGFGGFISKMWTSHDFQFVLNLLILGIAYLILLMLINRFWVATPVFLSIVGFCAVVERFKVGARYETIKPSDLNFLKSDAGNLASFIPDGSGGIFMAAAMFFLTMIVICYSLNMRDGRTKLIDFGDRNRNVIVRLLLILAPGLFLGFFTAGLATTGSWSNTFAEKLGDSPKLWDSVEDSQANGTLINFQRFVNPKVMDKPADYSEATMKKVAKRYAREAQAINVNRAANLDDSTVVMILSESFSDPTRVPGLSLNQDPMPNIRQIKNGTTSGLMLSAGYGGGTANMEFMAMTGLSMANFDASLSSPYQQLIPKLKWTPTFNQLWDGGRNSQAFHPYYASMYSRQEDYKKFRFSHFWTLQEPDVIAHQDKIDSSPYVKDSDAYQSMLEKIDAGKSQFMSILTMQNHMNYDNWYLNNEFQATSTTGVPLGLDETTKINTYAKGVQYTDQATKSLLDQLDNINKPITVIFYGDHLPGVYASASQDANNSVALHETDYFIWSNKASQSHGTKLPAETTAITSPNYFMAQVAEHMNAKVSPYLAFLTELHQKVPAMEPPVVNKIQSWKRIPEGQALYLDKDGNRVDISQADAKTQQLLEDYKLIQYDITDGEGYLKNTSFMDLPGVDAADAAMQKGDETPTGTKNAGSVPDPAEDRGQNDRGRDSATVLKQD